MLGIDQHNLVLYLHSLPQDSHRAMWAQTQIKELERLKNHVNIEPNKKTFRPKKCRFKNKYFETMTQAALILNINSQALINDINHNESQKYNVFLV